MSENILVTQDVHKVFTLGENSVNILKGINLEVKKGDTILYGKYSGTEVTIDSEDYLIMRESDILAVC